MYHSEDKTEINKYFIKFLRREQRINFKISTSSFLSIFIFKFSELKFPNKFRT